MRPPGEGHFPVGTPSGISGTRNTSGQNSIAFGAPASYKQPHSCQSKQPPPIYMSIDELISQLHHLLYEETEKLGMFKRAAVRDEVTEERVLLAFNLLPPVLFCGHSLYVGECANAFAEDVRKKYISKMRNRDSIVQLSEHVVWKIERDNVCEILSEDYGRPLATVDLFSSLKERQAVVFDCLSQVRSRAAFADFKAAHYQNSDPKAVLIASVKHLGTTFVRQTINVDPCRPGFPQSELEEFMRWSSLASAFVGSIYFKIFALHSSEKRARSPRSNIKKAETVESEITRFVFGTTPEICSGQPPKEMSTFEVIRLQSDFWAIPMTIAYSMIQLCFDQRLQKHELLSSLQQHWASPMNALIESNSLNTVRLGDYLTYKPEIRAAVSAGLVKGGLFARPENQIVTKGVISSLLHQHRFIAFGTAFGLGYRLANSPHIQVDPTEAALTREVKNGIGNLCVEIVKRISDSGGVVNDAHHIALFSYVERILCVLCIEFHGIVKQSSALDDEGR